MRIKSLSTIRLHLGMRQESFGTLISATNPMLGQDIYIYDSVRRVATHTDPKNNTRTFTRDGMGRITQVTYQDQSTKTYTYDCCHLNTVVDSVGTITFNYDTLKRVSSLTDVYNKAISYGYDKNNNLTTLTYPDSKIVNYQYDKADRLIKVTDWLNSVTTYDYDSASNLIKTTYPNGATIEYRYDNASRLKSMIDSKPDGTLNTVFNYTLNSLGNRTGIASHQPLNATPSWPNTSYTHDNDNRLLTAGSTTFQYDSNGNLITKTLGGNVTNYTWNYDDMLTQVTNGTNTYVYRYDGLGNRDARIENSVEKRYVGGLAETDASGNITACYVYGLALISKITPSNQSYFYHFDGVGSTIAMTDSTGSMVNKYAYDAFGSLLNAEETVSNPFLYVGQYGVMDEDNGLLYMRARYYDPEVGRFINKDPIRYKGGINLYRYVANNPLIFTDPSGLSEIIFDRSEGKIYIIPFWSTVPMLLFPAGNNTINPSGDPFEPSCFCPVPNGTFPMGSYIATGNDPNSAFGIGFIPIILPAVPPARARVGVGLHSGRLIHGGVTALTAGCIRTTDDAMHYLKYDPPTSITIQE